MQAEFLQLLENGDYKGLRLAAARLALPVPRNDEAAEIQMHMARTASAAVCLRKRHYSHRWLTERELPSHLPTEMRPTIVEAVGISVNFRSEFMRPAAGEVRGAMEAVVEDCFANGDRDPILVKRRMQEAKNRTMKALFG